MVLTLYSHIVGTSITRKERQTKSGIHYLGLMYEKQKVDPNPFYM